MERFPEGHSDLQNVGQIQHGGCQILFKTAASTSKIAKIAERVVRNGFCHFDQVLLQLFQWRWQASACLQSALGHLGLRSKTAQNCETVARIFSLPRCSHSDAKLHKTIGFYRGEWPECSPDPVICDTFLEGRKKILRGPPKRPFPACPPTSGCRHLRMPTCHPQTPNMQLPSRFTAQNGPHVHKTTIKSPLWGAPGYPADRPRATLPSASPAARPIDASSSPSCGANFTSD